ncbi:YqgE/AlgH family protein [uncultured Rhodospira sp.]|uniref:YqgE/AlgH family protein n=1 Tax=uncultured Rhodospira sp. TaxID=1936189 RepID=UPI002616DF66|nr:YqgE/AlgH family protein [uncultured Rhodospira sp.]
MVETFASVGAPDGYLTGKCLVAMPAMSDPRFVRSVIYICAHTSEGAMGLVVNRAIPDFSFVDLLEQLNIPATPRCQQIQVQFGGPVESQRGFVLHTADYIHEGTLVVDEAVALTATLEVLRDIAVGTGPSRTLMALGYAGWSPGQLDDELRRNVWLTVDADPELVFAPDLDAKYDLAMARMGIDPALLSSEGGHA